MNSHQILTDALSRAAVIHQAHSLKAYLSAKILESKLDSFGEKGWYQTQALIANGELAVSGLFTPSIQLKEFNWVRIDGILQRGIFPASYVAMHTWIAHEGIERVFAYYEQQAIQGNEYLLHTVSMLLSYKALWPELSDEQKPYFIERFTEFVTSTYYNKNHISYPLKAGVTMGPISIEYAFDCAITAPGFWGHNLICLSWLLQSQTDNSPEFNQAVLGFIVEQSYWQFTDDGDILDKARFEQIEARADKSEFYTSVQGLLYDSVRNIHQVTLAAALVDLWERASSAEMKQSLHRICQYFSKA